MTLDIRAATRDDARDIVELINIAGDGMPMAYWAGQGAPGHETMKFAMDRCKLHDGIFSWTRVTIAEVDGKVAGMRLSYKAEEIPERIDETVHPIFRPVVRLSTAAKGMKTLNTIAVYEPYRRQGVGTALLSDAEAHIDDGELALITPDVNDDGREFCRQWHYRTVDEAPVIKGPWQTKATSWQLLRKVAH